MIILKSKQNLEEAKSKIIPAIISSIELDLSIIESSYDEDNKPIVVVMKEDEFQELVKLYPILNELEPEDVSLEYKDETIEINRICYLIGEGGFVTYVQREVK